MSALVEEWFGQGFTELHPLLQRLHREGGVLRGSVEVSFGQGLAGKLGTRLASRMGVPVVAGTHQLQVTIHSESEVLHWGRSFNGQSEFNSKFKPVGHYPVGHWLEQSGLLSLVLGVEVRDGGWHWQHRKTSLFGIPVPRVLFPTTVASKCIEGEMYRFSVEVWAPALGKLLSYSGKLAPNPSIERTSPGKPGDASHVKR
jgi:hypothetical protein